MSEVLTNYIINGAFPATKVGAKGKLLTENNLTRLIYNLLDVSTQCFIAPLSIGSAEPIIANWGNAAHSLIPISPVGIDENNNLSVVMHGYQFNLGKIANIISNIGNGNDARIIMKIGIDTTVDDFNELCGQTDTLANLPGSAVSDFFKQSSVGTQTAVWYLKEEYRLYDINKILIENVECSISTSDYELSAPDTLSFNGGSSCEVEVYDYSNVIKFEGLGDSDSVTALTFEGIDSTNVHTYSLPILYRKSNQYYIPLDSFMRFDTYAIRSIDGGLI